MSKNGYARIERGESKLDMERLEKIAEIFSLEVVDLISQEYERAIFVIGGDSSNSSNNTGNNTTYYGNDHSLASENEKLKLIIQHKEELLAQKDNEIAALKKLVAALETNPQNP